MQIGWRHDGSKMKSMTDEDTTTDDRSQYESNDHRFA